MAIRAMGQVSVIDVTDAYSVYLTCSSYTFPGTVDHAKAGSCKTQVVALLGSDAVSASVDTSKCTCPTGVSVSSDADATSPTLTIAATEALKTSGTVTIPVTVNGDVEFTLEFSVAVALTGAKGDSVRVSSTEVTYQASGSGTTTPTGTWSASMPSAGAGQYVWTRTVVRYSDGASTTSYAVAYHGTNGTSVRTTGQSVTYLAGTSGTTAPTGSWSTSVPSVPKGQYLWTKTVVSYSDGASTTSYAVSYQGLNGAAGADALNLVISATTTTFKNSKGSATLSVKLFKGSQDVTSSISSYGTVHWYKNGADTQKTGTSITISAADVDGTATYSAQLEG